MKTLKALWFALATSLENQFYCFGCQENIHRDARQQHEKQGHKVSTQSEQYWLEMESQVRS